MATSREIEEEVNNFWDGWDGIGPEARDFDLEDCDMRRKRKEFKKRKEVVDNRKSEYEAVRNKYKRREE